MQFRSYPEIRDLGKGRSRSGLFAGEFSDVCQFSLLVNTKEENRAIMDLIKI